MRILFFIVLIILFILCVRKIRKMMKESQEIDMDEGRTPITGGRVLAVFAGGTVITGFFLWLFLSMGSPDLGSKHSIEKYTFDNHVLSFDLPQFRASYEISLPLYVNIKPTDKVDVRYFVDKGTLKNITGVFVNGQAVHDGSYQLVYKEIKTHR